MIEDVFKTGITYLLGAGASAKALPVMTQIPNSMQSIIDLISGDDFDLSSYSFPGGSKPTPEEMRQSVIKSLTWLKNESNNHASVDTFAKKLYLTKNDRDKEEQLNELRNILSLFLTLVQLKEPYDKRYDTFFASILQDDVSKFPKNIKILSWNYDYQLERAYQQYISSPDLIETWKTLNLCDKFHNKQPFSPYNFEVIKLNGTAQVYDHNRKMFFHYATKEDPTTNRFTFHTTLSKESFFETVYWYTRIKYTPSFSSTLHFAWEEDTEFIDYVKNALANTSVLVIIGYSFPFFNREVDRRIIQPFSKLGKVYFQDRDPETVIQRFQAIKSEFTIANGKAVPYTDCDQFLLPNEL